MKIRSNIIWSSKFDQDQIAIVYLKISDLQYIYIASCFVRVIRQSRDILDYQYFVSPSIFNSKEWTMDEKIDGKRKECFINRCSSFDVSLIILGSSIGIITRPRVTQENFNHFIASQYGLPWKNTVGSSMSIQWAEHLLLIDLIYEPSL